MFQFRADNDWGGLVGGREGAQPYFVQTPPPPKKKHC
jgi:hypothetical protein